MLPCPPAWGIPMRAFALLTVIATPLMLDGCKGCSDNELNPTGGDDDLDHDGSTEDPHDIGAWLSMEPTPDGKPAVAYYDRTKDALGFAIGTIADGGVTWKQEEVDSYPNEEGLNPGDAGKYASLAIASDGTAWIAYQDTTNGSLKYARRDTAGAWTTGIADVGGGPDSDAGYWASIALDASGNPVVAHYDHGKGDLRVARWNGTAFTGAVVYDGEDYAPADTGAATVPGDAGEYAKLLIAPDGTEYVAFYDRARGALRLAVGGPSGYAVEIVDDSADVGQWPDLLLEGGTLSIAYHDATNQDLKLATGSPGDFSLETLDTGDYVGADSAIYGTGGGDVAVLYFDGVNNDMKLARERDSAWISETVTGTGAATGFHNETIEIDGTRYAACYDYTARTIWFSALP